MFANIEAERSRLQMTKQQFSDVVGITTKTYRAYIQGDNPIPSDKLSMMADMFGCSTDYLLGRSDKTA